MPKNRLISKSANTNTVIASGIKVRGNLICEHELVFDGELVGNILCQETVVIGPNAAVSGNIESANLSVGGKVNGNVHVHGKLMIESSGQVNGEVKAASLKIDEGGVVLGQIIMPTDKTEPEEPEPVTDEAAPDQANET